MRSSARHSHAATSDVTWAHRLAWVVTTPFGLPVVPLVYKIMARRAAPTCGSTERPSAASASAVVRRRTAAGARTVSRRDANSGSDEDLDVGILDHVLELWWRVRCGQ